MLPSVRDYIEDKVADRIFQRYASRIFEANGVPTKSDGPPTPEMIKKAIDERFYVGIYYENNEDKEGEVKPGFRLIEPYVYGRGYKYGNNVKYPQREYLRVYVVKDTKSDPVFKGKKNFTRRKSVSKSKRTPYWRLMRVDRIKNWTVIPRKVTKYRELYDPNDDMMGEIIASVSKEEFSGGKQKLRLPKKLRKKVGRS